MRTMPSLLLLCLLLAVSARAQSPRTISFQGVLADQSGVPVSDGTHTLKLSLYAGIAGGTAVYTEAQTVPVAKGVFNLIIGSVTPIPASLPFDKPYYLGITVDNGAELAPRTALTAAPYALHASSAAALAPGASGVVTSLNGLSGTVTLQGAGSTTVTQNGAAITISSTGGSGGNGIQGLQNQDGTISIQSPTGPVATIGVGDNSIGALQLRDKAVSAGKLANDAVTETALANGAVTPAKVSAAGSTSGQVLTSNGASVAWAAVPGGSSGLTLPYDGQIGSAITAFSVSNSAGDALSATSSARNAVIATSSGTNAAAVTGISNGATTRAAVFVNLIPTNALPVVDATNSGTGDGIVGTSTGHNGVAGISKSAIENGVYGGNDAGGNGVMGRALGSGNAIIGFNGGTGRAGYFQVNNPSSTAYALEVNSNANAEALYAFSEKKSGVYGQSASSGGSGVVGVNNAGGSAVFGYVEAGAGNSIHAVSKGTGAALRSLSSGTGSAATFNIDNTASSAIAVSVVNAGTGEGVRSTSANSIGVWGISNSSTYEGVRGSNYGNGAGVLGQSQGSGEGVYGIALVSGRAGEFLNASASNTNIALYARTDGTGYPLVADAHGTGANIAAFQKLGVNKARIDNTGKGFFNGGTQNSGADVAELFEVEGDASSYEPGDVLVVSTHRNRTIAKSTAPYSDLLAGVYATKPGLLLTEDEIDSPMGAKVPMGVIGVLPTKVCLENGAIAPGDFLVSSSTPGHAMKADKRVLRELPGALLGKALESYDGSGPPLIRVLVSVK